VGLLLDRFERHVRDNFFVQSLEEEVIETAIGLVDRHPLRAYDALHLAGYVVLAQNSGKDVPIFACADERLLQAARSEKIPIFDPRTN
jgi:predicted nucleic acid-binding protein